MNLVSFWLNFLNVTRHARILLKFRNKKYKFHEKPVVVSNLSLTKLNFLCWSVTTVTNQQLKFFFKYWLEHVEIFLAIPYHHNKHILYLNNRPTSKQNNKHKPFFKSAKGRKIKVSNAVTFLYMCKQIPSVIYGRKCYFSQRKGKEKLFGFSQINGKLHNKRSFKLKDLFTAEKPDKKCLLRKAKKVNKMKLFVEKKKSEKFLYVNKNRKSLRTKVSMRISWIKCWLYACKKECLAFSKESINSD